MKKVFLIFTLIFILFSSTSCGPMKMPESSYEDAKLEEILKDNVTGIKSGINRKIPLSNLTDDKDNPIFDKWEAIEIYPLKEVSEDMFVYFYFNIYCEEICDALIHLTIEDEVIKYEIVKEKVIDPETGEITEIEKEVEVERYKEVINLTDEGEAVSFKNNEGNSFIYQMNYVIKSYSSSTCFKLILTDKNGEVIPYNWGIDYLQIFTTKIDENIE